MAGQKPHRLDMAEERKRIFDVNVWIMVIGGGVVMVMVMVVVVVVVVIVVMVLVVGCWRWLVSDGWWMGGR